MSNKPMTEQQRAEIKRLCNEVNVPDKSGELFTEESAQKFIASLREKLTREPRHPSHPA
jgi:hypothetical protein